MSLRNKHASLTLMSVVSSAAKNRKRPRVEASAAAQHQEEESPNYARVKIINWCRPEGFDPYRLPGTINIGRILCKTLTPNPNGLEIKLTYVDMETLDPENGASSDAFKYFSRPDIYPMTNKFAVIRFQNWADGGVYLMVLVPWTAGPDFFSTPQQNQAQWVMEFLNRPEMSSKLEEYGIPPHDLLVSETLRF